MKLDGSIFDSGRSDNLEFVPGILQFKFGSILDTLDGAFHSAISGLGLATDEANNQDGQDCNDVFIFHLIPILTE